jgi:hypothetical protein
MQQVHLNQYPAGELYMLDDNRGLQKLAPSRSTNPYYVRQPISWPTLVPLLYFSDCQKKRDPIMCAAGRCGSYIQLLGLVYIVTAVELCIAAVRPI